MAFGPCRAGDQVRQKVRMKSFACGCIGAIVGIGIVLFIIGALAHGGFWHHRPAGTYGTGGYQATPATGQAGLHMVHDGTFIYSVSCDKVWLARKSTTGNTTQYSSAFTPSQLIICQSHPGWDDDLTETGRQQLRNMAFAK